MFHPKNGITQESRPQASRDVTARMQRAMVERQFEDRFKALHTDGQIFSPLSVPSAARKLHQIEMKVARTTPGRRETNAATTTSVRNRGLHNQAAARIETTFEQSDGTLADQGKAHLARAALLKQHALKLNDLGHQGQVSGDTMQAKNASRGAIGGAIREEIFGVAALEGRLGLATRTGLKGEELDAYISKNGAGPLVDRFAAQSELAKVAEATPTPQQHWQDLQKTLDPKTFDAEIFKFRAKQIKGLYGDPTADRDTRVLYTATRQMNLEASKQGLTSTASMKLNQKLVSSLPEDSAARESMLAIRSLTLATRTSQKMADVDAR